MWFVLRTVCLYAANRRQVISSMNSPVIKCCRRINTAEGSLIYQPGAFCWLSYYILLGVHERFGDRRPLHNKVGMGIADC
jgi:hypothetical protein